MPQTIKTYVEEYAAAVRRNLTSGIGEAEAQLTTPVATLIENIGNNSLSLKKKI